MGVSTTWYALDVAVGLPEVLYTSEGNKYLHLPGLIMTESDTGERRYLLSDVLGSVRHVVDEAGTVVAYNEYSPYGEPVGDTETGYGFTGEWFERDIGLLHLRARWYDPGAGVFLSRDPWLGTPYLSQSMNGYNYVQGNVTNFTDPSGLCPGHPMCEDPWWPLRQMWEYAQQTLTSPPRIQKIPSLPVGSNECDEKPCTVILGANKLDNIGERIHNLSATANEWLTPYHHYILVADPNNKQRAGFELPKSISGRNDTIYYFAGFNEKVLSKDGSYTGPPMFGYLVTKSELYGEKTAQDFVESDDFHLRPQYRVEVDNADCDDILRCFRNTAIRINDSLPDYNMMTSNSNWFAKTLLHSCGIMSRNPVAHPAPGWQYNPDAIYADFGP